MAVVLPDPVGPVNRINPLGRARSLMKAWSVSSSKPRLPRSKLRLLGSNIRMTIFSPANGGEDGDAQFDSAKFDVGGGVTFLGQVGLVGDQVGHHLEAPGYFVHQIQGQMDQLVEHAIEANADHQGAFPGLNMDIAGPQFDSIEQQVIDQGADFNPLLVRNGLQITGCLVHGTSLSIIGDRISAMLRIFSSDSQSEIQFGGSPSVATF